MAEKQMVPVVRWNASGFAIVMAMKAIQNAQIQKYDEEDDHAAECYKKLRSPARLAVDDLDKALSLNHFSDEFVQAMDDLEANKGAVIAFTPGAWNWLKKTITSCRAVPFQHGLLAPWRQRMWQTIAEAKPTEETVGG